MVWTARGLSLTLQTKLPRPDSLLICLNATKHSLSTEDMSTKVAHQYTPSGRFLRRHTGA